MSGGMQAGGVSKELLTTKGDTHGFSSVNQRVGIGSNTQVLTADSTEALGLKWATPSSISLPIAQTDVTNLVSDLAAKSSLAITENWQYIETVTISSPNVRIADLSGLTGYTAYMIFFYLEKYAGSTFEPQFRIAQSGVEKLDTSYGISVMENGSYSHLNGADELNLDGGYTGQNYCSGFITADAYSSVVLAGRVMSESGSGNTSSAGTPTQGTWSFGGNGAFTGVSFIQSGTSGTFSTNSKLIIFGIEKD